MAQANAGTHVSFAARARIRPVLYPLGILVAFVLFLLVEWGISPWSAGRPLVIAIVLGLLLPWGFGFLTGDRDRAGVLATLVLAFVLAGSQPLAVLLFAGVFVFVLAEGRLRSHGTTPIRWPLITRAITAVATIALVAIGIAALQGGAIVRIPQELVAETPLGRVGATATAATGTQPSVYLVLVDGYPRADKLASEFGIDNEPFVRALRERDFAVADHSRSNFVGTNLTLASMFGGGHPGDLESEHLDLRQEINAGRTIQRFREAGYQIVAFSSGFESVALRRADKFIDTGQINEFEWNLLGRIALGSFVDRLDPALVGSQLHARILATLQAATAVVDERALGPRLLFVHLLAPHSPQTFGPSGDQVDFGGNRAEFDDSTEYSLLGPQEYSRRLGDQIAYLNSRVLGLVDEIAAEDPRAVVVVFSDHGSGVREMEEEPGGSDLDLRTANLLAVRSPGRTGIIDDRSTLVNLLPRILRAYTGSGPADVPEMIYGHPLDGQTVVFARPD
jgi:hypothetical protein